MKERKWGYERISNPCIYYWRPHGDSNSGYRRERPKQSVFHDFIGLYIRLKPFTGVESRQKSRLMKMDFPEHFFLQQI